MKQRAPALPDSGTFQQLWDALGSKLFESAREHLLYTRGSEVRVLLGEPIISNNGIF